MTMNERRAEIMRILTARRSITMPELARTFQVTTRTIQNDVVTLTVDYPLETSRGNGGFRATKAECLELPECTDIVQRVELEPAARRVYLQLVKDSYADLSSGSVTVPNVLTRLLRLSQLTGGFVGNDADAATEQV